MKRIVIFFVALAILVWPSLSWAISFTPQEVASIVKITSYLPKGAIDRQIRSLAGIFTDEELTSYRKQLESQIQTGSGLTVTYSGCALTNKHVIYDEESAGTNDHIKFWSTNNLSDPLNDLGEAEVVWQATLLDLAVVCLKNSHGRFYPHFTLQVKDYEDFKLTLGEEIYNLGYPINNENNSLTLTSGLVAGIWDKDYLKGDLLIAGGASGSPIFNSKKQVISLAAGNAGEAGSLGIFLKPSYVYGWHDLYSKTYRELIADAAGCLNSSQLGVYKKGEQEYYDLSCKMRRNFGLEAKLVYEYAQYCQTNLNIDEIVSAASYIASGKSTIDQWLSYLEKSCLAAELPVTVFEAVKE